MEPFWFDTFGDTNGSRQKLSIQYTIALGHTISGLAYGFEDTALLIK